MNQTDIPEENDPDFDHPGRRGLIIRAVILYPEMSAVEVGDLCSVGGNYVRKTLRLHNEDLPEDEHLKCAHHPGVWDLEPNSEGLIIPSDHDPVAVEAPAASLAEGELFSELLDVDGLPDWAVLGVEPDEEIVAVRALSLVTDETAALAYSPEATLLVWRSPETGPQRPEPAL